jgi:hypothetical protein
MVGRTENQYSGKIKTETQFKENRSSTRKLRVQAKDRKKYLG